MRVKIITIDGPSGVGKGTLAEKLADYLGFHLLDSGALYRLTAINAKRLSLDPDNGKEAGQAVDDLAVAFKRGKVFLHGQEVSQAIRSLEAGQLASRIAVHPVVREKLFSFMQDFVRPPGIVADGRDMGSVVFSGADLKLFLTAAAEVRAKRRYKQLKDNGKDVNLNDVFSELIKRDGRDTSRQTAPLEPAKDAVVIDSGALDVLQVFEKAKTLAALRGIVPHY
ncbi:MAG: cytidylate kinase [Gammaproteobacteria bacterium]|nr:MAG: cytidylate kinase [Gammaproteobacteria bacterium]